MAAAQGYLTPSRQKPVEPFSPPIFGSIPKKVMEWTAPSLRRRMRHSGDFSNHTLNERNHPMPIVTIGLNLAKSVFQLHAIDKHGAVIMRKRLTRGQVLPVLEKIPPCLLPSWDGSLQLGPSLGARNPSFGP